MNKINKVILSLGIVLFAAAFTSCSEKTLASNSVNESEQVSSSEKVEVTIRYDLVEQYSNCEEINVEEMYEYYYVEFNEENKEYKLDWKRKDDGETQTTFGTYTETDSQYIVSANGLSFSYVKIGENRIECKILTTTFMLEKAK